MTCDRQASTRRRRVVAGAATRHGRPLTEPRLQRLRRPRSRRRRYRVSRVDRYVDCPFKYFAENVLGLPEEREEDVGPDAARARHARPRAVRAVLSGVAARGPRHDHGRDAARRARSCSARSPTPRSPSCPRPIARSRRRGCSARSSRRGVAERVFELEADEGGTIVDRLVECRCAGRSVSRVSPASSRRTSRSAARPIASTCSTTARFA